RDAVAARLGDASGNHVADHQRVQMYFGMDAELFFSVRSTADAAGPVGAVRSLVGSRTDQLLGTGPVQQHAGVPECVLRYWIEERGPAILVRNGRERFCRDPIGHYPAIGAGWPLG